MGETEVTFGNEMDAGDQFFERPVLNSPYDCPERHWELDESRQPTGKIITGRREVSFITPIPAPRKAKGGQEALVLDEKALGAATDDQQYSLAQTINRVRRAVDEWRAEPDSRKWRVTPETERLLRHWRDSERRSYRPFFCQVEAVETLIWLTEVAPDRSKTEKAFLDHLHAANEAANPGLSRLALKLATGAGKTTVMAMLIAWQTINAERHRKSTRFTNAFLIVTPGITIKDRLRVLQPNDPDNYYRNLELVPDDMLGYLNRARIVITNFHAFKQREATELSKGGRALLRGHGPDLDTQETEGQMLRRVMPDLQAAKSVLVINDEAHHCYREKAGTDLEGDLTGLDKAEADKNREAARLWITGLEAVARTTGVLRVIDLSATPFFLRGSGYSEGTLFPWTMCDFSLMDAIECGIVKLPRVPVADNVSSGDMPKLRELWKYIGSELPKKGRRAVSSLDPLKLPVLLQTALAALYGNYAKTFAQWQEAGIEVPPCFIVVCNNTATSKLVYDYISGFRRERPDGSTTIEQGRLELFRNFDEHGNALDRPRTLLIDSEQLESGQSLDSAFRTAAADEIERFRLEIVERTGDKKSAEEISDQDLLREVMNTVGKQGRLGGETRCVVSVSMLTEGWDANTVTHVMGVRAFGTQLLCEQAVGRALRRLSYDLNEDDVLPAEYADVIGIPFDFTAEPVAAPPQKPRKTTEVRAITPDRDACEIQFPRVQGYRIELPEERLEADFGDDSTMVLTPDRVGPTHTRNEGIIGQGVDLDLVHNDSLRPAALLYELTARLLMEKWREPGGQPKLHLFGQLKRITRQWLENHLDCRGGTYPAQLMYASLADEACDRITRAIVKTHVEDRPEDRAVQAVLDSYNPSGSTREVHFTTTKTVYRTDPSRCHINYVVCDSDWEEKFSQVAERNPRVIAYMKNHPHGLRVPYRVGGEARTYIPDFIVLVEDGRGEHDLLHLVVEIKGYRKEDAKGKKSTIETYWVPGVNALGTFGRWSFAEFRDVDKFESEFGNLVDSIVMRQAA